MSNNDLTAIQTLNVFEHLFLCLLVQGRSSLVHDQHHRLTNQGTGDCYPLLLTTRKKTSLGTCQPIPVSILNHSFSLLLVLLLFLPKISLLYKTKSIRHSGCLLDLIESAIQVVLDVIYDRSIKESRLLRNYSEPRPFMLLLIVSCTNLIDQNLALLRRVNAKKQVSNSCLTSTRLPNNSHSLSRLHHETKTLKQILPPIGVAEVNIFKLNTTMKNKTIFLS